jgi:hypothetical protein
MSCASTAASPADLTAEEASAALVAMLGGRTLTSIDEIREVAEHLRARRHRPTGALIADIKAVGQQLVQAMAGDDMVAAGPNQLAAQARGRALAKCWNALCDEVWERPVEGLQDAVALAYVAIFNAQATEPERLGDVPFVKLCLAVIDLEEVHHA